MEWIGILIGIILIPIVFLLANMLGAKKIPTVLTMLAFGFIMNIAFVETGVMDEKIMAGMLITWTVLGMPMLAFLIYKAGTSIDWTVIKKNGLSGIGKMISPFAVETLFWTIILTSLFSIPGFIAFSEGWELIGSILVSLIIGVGISVTTNGVVLPKFFSEAEKNPNVITKELKTIVPSSVVFEGTIGFIIFIIAGNLLSSGLGNVITEAGDSNLMDLAYIPLMFVISPIIGLIFGWLFSTKIVPSAAGLPPQIQKLFPFLVFVPFSLFIFMIGDLISVSGFTPTIYDGILGVMFFGFFSIFFATKATKEKNQITSEESVKAVNGVGGTGAMLFTLIAQPALFVKLTFDIDGVYDMFGELWMYILVLIPIMFVATLIKFFISKLVWKESGDIVGSSLVGRGNNSFTWSLLIVGIIGSGTTTDSLIQLLIVTGLIGAIFNIPVFEYLFSKSLKSKQTPKAA